MEELTGLLNEKWLLKDIKEYWYKPVVHVLSWKSLFIEDHGVLKSMEDEQFHSYYPDNKILVTYTDSKISIYIILIIKEIQRQLFKEYKQDHKFKVLKLNDNLLYMTDSNNQLKIININTDEQIIFDSSAPLDRVEYHVTGSKIIINNYILNEINIYDLSGKHLDSIDNLPSDGEYIGNIYYYVNRSFVHFTNLNTLDKYEINTRGSIHGLTGDDEYTCVINDVDSEDDLNYSKLKIFNWEDKVVYEHTFLKYYSDDSNSMAISGDILLVSVSFPEVTLIKIFDLNKLEFVRDVEIKEEIKDIVRIGLI
jgi:hypothetical protein